jgi:hypothetical protein
VQTDATCTCELLVGLRDVTVLGVDERLRQPDEVCVDLQQPWIHRPIAIPEGSGAPVRRRHQSGACPRSALPGKVTIATTDPRSGRRQASLPVLSATQASRVIIRHAPRTVQATSQATMTQTATVVDSGTSNGFP